MLVYARAKSKPGHEEKLRGILRELVQASRAESGVLAYELFETKEGGEFLFHEEYADENAFESHRASQHIATAVRRAFPIMDGGLTLWFVEPVALE